MKRIFVTLTLAICLVSFSASAADKTSPDVLKTFYHQFSKAENVNWTEVDGMTRIGFNLDGQSYFAYYSNDELIVVAKQIVKEDLPLALQAELTSYKDIVVTEVYELRKDGKTEYCVVLNGDSKHLVLKGRTKLKVFLKERN